MKDRPPCPKCGHQVPYDPDDPDEKAFREMEELLIKRMEEKDES